MLRENERVELEIDRAALKKAIESKDPKQNPWLSHPLVKVMSRGPAAAAGMVSGSRVKSVDGTEIRAWESLTGAVEQAGEKEVEIVWETPDGTEQKGTSKLRVPEYESLGLVHSPSSFISRVPLHLSPIEGAKRIKIVAQQILLTLRTLFRGKLGAKNLAGPVGIVHVIYRVSEHGFGTLFYYLAMISVNLGILNLLPFPILDGGHLLFLLIEKIKGSPVDVRIQEVATMVAFVLIIGLALFVTWNDVGRLFGA